MVSPLPTVPIGIKLTDSPAPTVVVGNVSGRLLSIF
ncbi:MAG: hypothetical protein CM1200mP18_16400 [Gammaproteobacteria bacterium]|nr:MAG: hypothetical protein CM1200mP18_16400 [Gammaproteobacteria bacterium]